MRSESRKDNDRQRKPKLLFFLFVCFGFLVHIFLYLIKTFDSDNFSEINHVVFKNGPNPGGTTKIFCNVLMTGVATQCRLRYHTHRGAFASQSNRPKTASVAVVVSDKRQAHSFKIFLIVIMLFFIKF